MTPLIAPDIPARRRSLPATSRSHPNHVNVAPASPEIITNLLTSLAVISTPASRLFDGLPASHSTPSSPSPYETTFDSSFTALDAMGTGFGMDYGAFDSLTAHEHPTTSEALDELAAPSPSIRIAKPPSGFSPLTAPPKSPRDPSPFKTFLGKSSRPGSKSSSLASKDDSSSVGTISIEPGTVPTSDLRRKSSGDSWGKKRVQPRNQKGLMYMSSRERLREKDQERKRNSASAVRSSSVGAQCPPLPKLQLDMFMAETPIREESSTGHDQERHISATDVEAGDDDHSPQDGSHSPAKSVSSIADRFIPARDSSLRKPAAATRKRASNRSSRRRSREKDFDTPMETQRAGSHPRSQALSMLEPLDTFMTPARVDNSAMAINQGSGKHEEHRDDIIDDAEDGAPFPAVAQRRARSSERPSILAHPSKRRSAVITQDATESSLPKRTSSRLKRLSAPLSPRSSEPYARSDSRNQTRSPEPTHKPPHVHIDERPSTADSVDNAVEAYLCSPRLSQKIRHPQSGRTISFSEVGDSNGFAVFCCVGMGLTRYIMTFYDELASTLKLRLITPDRPGVGDSEPYNDNATPLSWPDDVYAICQALKITKFSILAHSAGAIYALATALRMPQHIRGRIHLLAPWIPPSQMHVFGSTTASPPTNSLPTSQRILRALPASFLKAANSSFMSATSSSITSSLPKQKRSKRKSTPGPGNARHPSLAPADKENLNIPASCDLRGSADLNQMARDTVGQDAGAAIIAAAASDYASKDRQATYDNRLTHAIWDLATSGANPAVDLLVCLERRHAIGFRYVDITRPVVIHHGSKDTRVPVENVEWLGRTMKRCEVRVLEGEGHGLMASAAVMGSVLMEIAREWEDWTNVTRSDDASGRLTASRKASRDRLSFR